LADSKIYLLNSIDLASKQEINPFMLENTSGPELWMHSVGTVQSFTIERLTTVKGMIQAMKVKDFTEENMKANTQKVIGYCKDLEAIGKLPEKICYIIVTHVSECAKIKQEVANYFGKVQVMVRQMQI
jgi:hypothetical protein